MLSTRKSHHRHIYYEPSCSQDLWSCWSSILLPPIIIHASSPTIHLIHPRSNQPFTAVPKPPRRPSPRPSIPCLSNNSLQRLFLSGSSGPLASASTSTWMMALKSKSELLLRSRPPLRPPSPSRESHPVEGPIPTLTPMFPDPDPNPNPHPKPRNTGGSRPARWIVPSRSGYVGS